MLRVDVKVLCQALKYPGDTEFYFLARYERDLKGHHANFLGLQLVRQVCDIFKMYTRDALQDPPLFRSRAHTSAKECPSNSASRYKADSGVEIVADLVKSRGDPDKIIRIHKRDAVCMITASGIVCIRGKTIEG